MEGNMGSLDRGVRIIIALVIQGLFFTNVLDGLLAIVFSSIIGCICPN